MSLTPQAHFYRPSAAASFPFRRLSAHSPGWRFPTLRIGRPNLDLRSRFGQPVHNPKSLSVLFPPQRLLHSATASALANPKRSADLNTPHRTAHTQRANFTLAHESVLVKFSFSRTATHCPRLAARSFSSICRPSERRNRFLQSEQTLCGSFLAAGCFSHSKGLVYFLSQALPRPLRSKASNPSAATDIPTAPTLPTISNRTTSRNMVSNVRSPQSDTVPSTQSLLTTLPRQPLSSFRWPSILPTARADSHIQRAPRRLPFLPSPAPNHPPFGWRARRCRACALNGVLRT